MPKPQVINYSTILLSGGPSTQHDSNSLSFVESSTALPTSKLLCFLLSLVHTLNMDRPFFSSQVSVSLFMVSALCFLYYACLFGSGHVGSLVGAQEFLVTAQFPDEGSNPDPLHWELRVLVTRPPGKSLYTMFKSQNVTDCNHAVLSCV